jgi:signal transduction histidine kinase
MQRALSVQVTAALVHDDLVLSISDNGVGIGSNAPQPPGRGNGLTLHSTLLMVVGGGMTVSSAPGGGTLVRLSVPASPHA